MHAGQQAAGGLRIEQQRIARVLAPAGLVADAPAQPDIGRLQRTQDAGGHGFFRPRQYRNGGQRQFGVDSGGPGHLDQVAQQTETGDIGTGPGTMAPQAVGGQPAGLHHRGERGVDPAPLAASRA